MSHRSHAPDDVYDMDPKDILTQYSVEWVALRKSFAEVKTKLSEVQTELNELDEKLERKKIDDKEHMEKYHEKWLLSTQIVQVKRDVESRLYEIQKELRRANKQLKQAESEQQRRERIEEQKSGAMIEWMSLKQGFTLVKERRLEINQEMNALEMKRRTDKIKEEEYRKSRVDQIRKLAELSTVESDVKRRLAELLELIRS
ncbi:MAG: hypothetical protein KAR33_13160 [Candidatus Thorarchaeota archaeon]|nr:hypothetical protein [Candidatus Thorarchaeota archaeon]